MVAVVVVVKEGEFNEGEKDETTLTLGRRTTVAKRGMCFAAATTASLRSISWQSVCHRALGHGGDSPSARAAAHNRKRQRGVRACEAVHDHPDGWRNGRTGGGVR